MVETGEFIKMFGNKIQKKIIRYAKIDPDYTSGRPSVIFDGETVPTVKKYLFLSSYSPRANDRVAMLHNFILGKVGDTYEGGTGGSGDYAPINHDHNGAYAPLTHNHEDKYVGWGLGGTAKRVPSKDWNDVETTGFYMEFDCLNQPTSLGAHEWKYVQVIQHNNLYIVQIAHDFYGKYMWKRVCVEGSWGPWTNQYNIPTFLNGWVNYDNGFTYETAAYLKNNEGFVELKGLIKNGTGLVIFNLPAGYRPSKRKIFTAVSADAFGRIDVDPNGDVIKVVGSNTWISLDGIIFRAEQ